MYDTNRFEKEMKIPTSAGTIGPGLHTGPDINRGAISTLAGIADTCRRCGICGSECPFLEKHGHPGEIASDILTQKADESVAFLCSLCGLCRVVCPAGLDPARMFLDLRQQATDKNHRSLRGYRRLLNYEARGSSKRFAWYGLPENCTTVFFPGCALPGTRPKQTLKLYALLQARNQNLGIVLDCCTKPSHDLGRQRHFAAVFSALKHRLQDAGITNVITACPSCHEVFTQYGQGLHVTSVYEHLASAGFTAGASFNSTVTVHDPCVSRDNPGMQEAVRTLIRAHGLKIFEMPYAKERTLCCGEGGGVGCLDRNLLRKWRRKRQTEARDRPVLTYCAGCTAQLGKSVPSAHLIDLLLAPERTMTGKVRPARPPLTTLNRLRLKRILQRQGRSR